MLLMEETWGNIPLLHIVEKDAFDDKKVPVVIFLHGFTSAKEHNLHYAYNMAKRGLRVLLPDADLHGARSEQLTEEQLYPHFWEIVLKSIEEVGLLRKELLNRNITAKIGLSGTSMGGITALGCLTAYHWIDTAAVMMGAPDFVELAKGQIRHFERNGLELPMSGEERNKMLDRLGTYDLAKNPSTLNHRPIFFWHGKQDTIVPYEPTYQFYESIQKDYEQRPEYLKFESDENAGHAVPRKGMLLAAEWMARHLND
ncbi:prolyl oligopeptidase family serine peptidase [Sporosarcina sp. HYO08]|uniref:prolyl oligopeptidase family serine peptidase n=1 Tax=Sporosarcina sp. HYO08 TaxID=1759557 RepID=UPI00079494EB|nr:prolyl oligopeptidase family serine peptidase [Sporosarcina sp. HYO08]KXH80086.1 esterase [Sporosarcina sp. HYO08]